MAMQSTDRPAVALISLGCPKNLVDSEVMLGLLNRAGFPIVQDVADADVAIVNTCAFIEPAQEEAVDALLDLAEMKAEGSLRAIVCTGCLPQRYGPQLHTELPEIDIFVQIGAETSIVEAVEAAAKGQQRFLEGSGNYGLTCDLPRWRSDPQWLSYIRIADGCDHRCSFCTIPAIRGPYQSRRPQDIVSEYRRLVDEGVQELVLIAQDTTAYGHDLPGDVDLTGLLKALGSVEFDGWLRLMYAYPARVDARLLQAMADMPAMVPYLEVPLQHVSQPILKAMRRPGDAESYLQMLAMARQFMPALAVRTTFLLGFPGETDHDFELLLDFVAEARFDRVSAFAFSPEESTPAAEMPGQVSVREALDRMEELMRVQEAISLERNRALVGREIQVLVESELPDEQIWLARSWRDAPEVDCQVKVEVIAGAPLPRIGRFAQVRITGAEMHDLQAQLIHL
jgi:ribosomal protein S12 methylthiotransferase